jgi:hypothetical protein
MHCLWWCTNLHRQKARGVLLYIIRPRCFYLAVWEMLLYHLSEASSATDRLVRERAASLVQGMTDGIWAFFCRTDPVLAHQMDIRFDARFLIIGIRNEVKFGRHGDIDCLCGQC